MSRRIQILPSEYKSTVRHRTVADAHAALTTELAHLRAEIKRLEGIIKFKDGVLLHTARFFEDVLRENKYQSIERVRRLISQLKGAADREQGGLPDD